MSLSSSVDESLYSHFSSSFDFVFLDQTGYVNLAASLSSVVFEQMRVAASDALVKISKFDEFDSTFVEKHPFSHQFDFYIK